MSEISATYRLRNDLYCVEWGVKLYSNQSRPLQAQSELRRAVFTLLPEAHQQVPAVRCMDDEPEPEPETTGLGLAKMVSRLHRRLSTTFQSVSGLIPPKMFTRSAASLFLGRAVLISRRNRTVHFWSGSWAITPSRIRPQAGTCT